MSTFSPVAVLYTSDGTPVQITGGVLRIDPTGTTIQPVSSSDILAKTSDIVAELVNIRSSDGIRRISDALPSGDNGIGQVKIWDGTGAVSILSDTAAGYNRLAIEGNVSVTAPEAPPSTTAVQLFAPRASSDSTELEVAGNSSHDTEYAIGDGNTLTIQYVQIGAQGDPNERGSRIEIIYDDVGTERMIERFYATSFSAPFSPNVSSARDGTALTGNAGGTKKLVIRRTRLAGGSGEIDVEIRGYEV